MENYFTIEQTHPNIIFPVFEFITWNENTGNTSNTEIYWGNEVEKEFNEIIVHGACKRYDELNAVLEQLNSCPSACLKATFLKAKAYFQSLKENAAAIGDIDVRDETAYSDLYSFYWKKYWREVWDFCPRRDLNKLLEWHNLLLFWKIDKLSKNIPTTEFPPAKRIRASIEFAEEMIAHVEKLITESRAWYEKTYKEKEANLPEFDKGNDYTLYPIGDLKEYSKWLKKKASKRKNYDDEGNLSEQEISNHNANTEREPAAEPARPVESANNPLAKPISQISFSFTGINKHKSLENLLNALVGISKIDNTTLPVFRNAFLGKKIEQLKGKILWSGTVPELKCLIDSLLDCKKIEPVKNKWQIVAQVFKRSTSDNYTAENLAANSKAYSQEYKEKIDYILSRL